MGGYYRSGTTWVRYIVEYTTHRPAVSEYYDKPGWDIATSGDPIIIKTRSIVPGRWDKCVWLMRNPYDALLSYFDWLHNFSEHRPEWDAFVDEQLPIWRDINAFWDSFQDTLLVHYEDAMHHSEDVAAKIVEYLGIDADGGRIREAAETAKVHELAKWFPDDYFPRGESGHGAKRFSKEQKQQTRDICGRLARWYTL